MVVRVIQIGRDLAISKVGFYSYLNILSIYSIGHFKAKKHRDQKFTSSKFICSNCGSDDFYSSFSTDVTTLTSRCKEILTRLCGCDIAEKQMHFFID